MGLAGRKFQHLVQVSGFQAGNLKNRFFGKSSKALRKHQQNCFQTLPKRIQNIPNTCPNHAQTIFRPSPNMPTPSKPSPKYPIPGTSPNRAETDPKPNRVPGFGTCKGGQLTLVVPSSWTWNKQGWATGPCRAKFLALGFATAGNWPQ